MEKDFSVTILSLERKVYEGRAVSLIAPCETGYWGILSNHAPFIANIVPGKVTLREKEGESKEIRVETNGFLEVFENNATILI